MTERGTQTLTAGEHGFARIQNGIIRATTRRGNALKQRALTVFLQRAKRNRSLGTKAVNHCGAPKARLNSQTGSADPRCCCKNQDCDHCGNFLSQISPGIISKARAIGKNEKSGEAGLRAESLDTGAEKSKEEQVVGRFGAKRHRN